MLTKIDWKPNRQKIRYFSITLMAAVILFALLLYLRGMSATAYTVGLVGTIVSVASFLIIPFGRVTYLIWMAISYLLGRIVSPIIIAVIFYLVVTPLALFFRLIGRDQLHLRKPKNQSSYFTSIDEKIDGESFRRQF